MTGDEELLHAQLDPGDRPAVPAVRGARLVVRESAAAPPPGVGAAG